jgi:hypothetical protein
MSNGNVTCGILSLGVGDARVYTNATVKASIQLGGSNFNGFGFSTYAKYAHTAFIPDVVREGDRITDANGTLYDIHNTEEIWWLDNFVGYQCELFRLKTATLKTLTLGTRDSVTGWPTRSYVDSTITLNLAAKGASTTYTSAGFYGKYDYAAVSSALILEGDIIEVNGKTYDVIQSNPFPTKRSDGFTWTVCYLVQREFTQRPDTSGTWHLDSESIRTDPRNRIKTWLDAYLIAGNIAGDYATMFALPQGEADPITRAFLTEDLDCLFTIDKVSASADRDSDKVTYAFTESVPITVYAVNKTAITATNLVEQAEQEIRRIVTAHPLGSVKSIERIDHKPVVLGNVPLYSSTITIRYRRVNDDYAGSGKTLTYGTAPTNGTFTFPNITYISPPTKVNNTRLMPPTRMGNVLQKLGMPDFAITVKCDLDMEPATLTWKRAQTTTPKSDVKPWQIFLDVQFNGQLTEPYQTLNLGLGGTLQVTLEEVVPEETPEGTMLSLTFYTYNSASGSAYKTWFGI